MKPLSEHETVIQVLREMVEQVISEASPTMATVTGVGSSGEVFVRLDDEETARSASVPRNPGGRIFAGDRVIVIRTLANQLVIACPVASTAAGTQAARIGSEHLIDQSVTAEKIGTGAVTAEKIGTGAVTAEKLAGRAVGPGTIDFDAVGTAQILAGSVTNVKIATGAVSADKIAPGVIPTTFTPGANSITTGMLQNGAVTTEKLGSRAVRPGQIDFDAVGTAQILAGSVTAAKINEGAVTENKIATDAVVSSKIKTGAVIPEKLDRAYANATHNHQASQVNGTLQWNNVKDITVPTHKGNKTLNVVLSDLYKKAFP